MKINFVLFIFLFLSPLKAAEFIYDVYGSYEIIDTISVLDGKTNYMIYQNTGVFTSNTPFFGTTRCSGIFIEKEGLMSIDTLCENTSGKYKWYPRFINKNKEGMTNIFDFVVSEGNGPWAEMVGQKCSGAYVPIEPNSYMYKGKCNIPDASFERMINFKDE